MTELVTFLRRKRSWGQLCLSVGMWQKDIILPETRAVFGGLIRPWDRWIAVQPGSPNQTVQLSRWVAIIPPQTGKTSCYGHSTTRIYPKCRGFCLAKYISFPPPQLGLRTLLVCILPSGSLVPGCHRCRPETQCGR